MIHRPEVATSVLDVDGARARTTKRVSLATADGVVTLPPLASCRANSLPRQGCAALIDEAPATS